MSEEVEMPVEPVQEPVAPVVETLPEPKKKGRPQGSKDTIKRTRKPVQIRVEPLQEKQAAPPASKPEVSPQAPEPAPVEIEEPKTPRTLIRETSRHLVSLRQLVNDNRKSEMAQRYTQKWSKWPL